MKRTSTLSKEVWPSALIAIHKFNGLVSGAGLTHYVELENFLAMREALAEYGLI